ncbi:probable protein phosphatase 2C 26 isoform X1 [Euphorbia lathyris]|uniref:probable protein phosphatase 2C 26 isoform X1 n=1 Tax=Euphorbia lathyris TaxID=212925 RepID=UPI0033130CC0
MAIPILRDSISCSTHPLFCSSVPNPTRNCNLRKNNCFCLPSSQLNPVQLANSFQFSVGTHLIPHPNKIERGGEDALLVSSYNGGVIAVADGVSGWAEENVDPSLFPRELMANALSFLRDEEQVNYEPQILLKKAHAATSSTGSATVIVAMLEKHGILKIANVGDCGLRIIRGGQIIFASSPQEHYFDCPYQLSSEMVGQTYIDAMVSKVELMEGDTIVMGSDGLFDNVFNEEIVSTMAKHTSVAEAAKALANLANIHSTDSEFESPYALEARSKGFDVPLWKKILGRKLTGGKLDDITVVVGRVMSSSDSEDKTHFEYHLPTTS